ncbi:hypothetical protein [Parahaliea mediterranea]|uniref:hypothetical protein n=1 Tax=Parahaliea mediterranea TaxID=651086 RepID=UPI000E2F9655|nr:hypothetical protein [Parahaliea mediterranea]
MGREVRMVPADWDHPKNEHGKYKPLYPPGYQRAAQEFMEKAQSEGLQEAVEWFGGAPDKDDYMPDWPDSERTHYMMYEDTSEGTPISPAFPTPEELARWLADTGASSFGSQTATYDQWLPICRGGWAPSMVMTDGKLMSGVEFAATPTGEQP